MPASDTNRPASVADVARAAGVSTQTVSRVLNDVPTVKAANREKVLQAMRELNYHLNPAARMLKQRRFRSIGIVLYHVLMTGKLETLVGISQAAQERGYTASFISMARKDSTVESLLQRAFALPVDGIVFATDGLIAAPSQLELPNDKIFAVITASDEAVPYSTVREDPRAYVGEVIEHLVEHGHRHIAHLTGPQTSSVAQRRLEAWREAMSAHGLDAEAVYAGDWTADSGYAAGQQLANETSCTAVYCANDAMAYGLMCALEDAGKRVPDDVSVIGTDDSLRTTVPNNRLTSIDPGYAEMGRVAAQETIDAIEAGTGVSVPFHRVVTARLVERETVRDLR